MDAWYRSARFGRAKETKTMTTNYSAIEKRRQQERDRAREWMLLKKEDYRCLDGSLNTIDMAKRAKEIFCLQGENWVDDLASEIAEEDEGE
jgi:hypothetical protein